MCKSFLFLILGIGISFSTFAEGKLIFAIDIIRHGDRTPLIESKAMQKIWPQGLGQLTQNGMHEAYLLGKSMRELYVNQSHLLPASYDSKRMTVRSSDMDRTLMTAQSFLYGLYPLGTGPLLLDHKTPALPEAFQPIPVHTVPIEKDGLLVPNHDRIKYRQWLETYIFNDPIWIEKDNRLRPQYAAWSKAANVPINSLFELLYVADRLFIERLYHIVPPDGMTTKDVDEILKAGEWALLYIVNHPTWADIVGTELAQTIKKEILLASEKKRALNYVLFVAHDTTIAAQLKRLGQNLKKLPPYTAQLHYELYDMGGFNYKVSVSYLQKPLWIKACGGYTCSLNDFTSLFTVR